MRRDNFECKKSIHLKDAVIMKQLHLTVELKMNSDTTIALMFILFLKLLSGTVQQDFYCIQSLDRTCSMLFNEFKELNCSSTNDCIPEDIVLRAKY